MNGTSGTERFSRQTIWEAVTSPLPSVRTASSPCGTASFLAVSRRIANSSASSSPLLSPSDMANGTRTVAPGRLGTSGRVVRQRVDLVLLLHRTPCADVGHVADDGRCAGPATARVHSPTTRTRVDVERLDLPWPTHDHLVAQDHRRRATGVRPGTKPRAPHARGPLLTACRRP